MPPKSSKSPKLAGSPAIEEQYLAWRFSNRDQDGPYSWGGISDKDQQAVWERLAEFERKTVQALKAAGSHHGVALDKLSKDAKKRLRELHRDDLDELWSFRISGKRRLWCIKHENVYALLWWDPSHAVYLVAKKGT